MQERDSLALGPDARFVIDELKSRLAATLERRVQVVDGKANVVNSGSALRDVARDRRAGVIRLQELDEGFAGAEAGYARAICIIERNLG